MSAAARSPEGDALPFPDEGVAQQGAGRPGPTWVLLRGLTREARHWGPFPEIFRAALPDARVLTPDLPGNGRCNDVASPTRVGQMVDFVRADVRGRGAAPPYWLLGLSLGGMVAVEWASRHPGEVAGCVLINTSMRPLGRFFERLRPRQYATLLRLALARRPETRERLILAATSRLTGDGAALLRAWTAWCAERPVSQRNALRQLLAAARYRAPGERPAAPILLLAGARDAFVNPACSARLAGHWGVPLRVHPDAGHDLPLDDGRWVAEQVRAWCAASLREHENSAPL